MKAGEEKKNLVSKVSAQACKTDHHKRKRKLTKKSPAPLQKKTQKRPRVRRVFYKFLL
jgi:hypothetical protein